MARTFSTISTLIMKYEVAMTNAKMSPNIMVIIQVLTRVTAGQYQNTNEIAWLK